MAVPLRVLILEDRIADAELMLRELRRAGFDLHARVVDTEAAYLAELDTGPDVILADYSLPQFDARRALRLLRERGLEVPVIVVTGSLSDEDAVACIKEGAADYLIKDRMGRLGQAVARTLEERRLRQERQAERDERIRAEAARAVAEAAERRFAFLAEASRVLSSSLDYETTLGQVARLAVPFLADYCVVEMADVSENGASGSGVATHPVAIVHADPRKEALLRDAIFANPPDPRLVCDLARVVGTGEPILAEATADSAGVGHADLELRSYMILPLVGRGRTLGVIRLMAGESGRSYGKDDLLLAEELAGRAALAVDNARLYQEAQEALRSRNEFFSSISHDLKTPLTVIKGQAQYLARHLLRRETPDLARLQEGLENIEATASTMSNLINQILDLARWQSSETLDLDLRPTDLVALARQAVEQHQITTDAHRIQLDADVAELVGLWDPARLERVLHNLIGNAVKYSPRGGDVVVEVALLPGNPHPRATVRVRDQGIGIPAEDLPRLFRPFQRGSNLSRRFGGTGIGLVSARQIVEQHGGTIAVESQEGVGSTFTVQLPLVVRQS